MITQDNWGKYLEQAGNWIRREYPHFNRTDLDLSFEDYTKKLNIELVDDISIKGHSVDALVEDSLSTIQVNRTRVDSLSEKERVALLIHEITEGYGIASFLYQGYVVRPEHEYAEYVETRYRQENNLPRCELELKQETFELMDKMNEFYKKFHISGVYMGTVLYFTLLKDPTLPVDESLKSKVMDELN
ncbi:hypothetical protein COU57_03130 [Candidatus Pacearchaeota archaeon CG10_big_fil_rev_8_21_14_0_10_32_14]|nr:MAG: hypothetical protein COU57_03130 [Candidatus Pacearchaeota archaeon CG10_big_fil_rev_8_21_14_0_10_32_14]